MNLGLLVRKCAQLETYHVNKCPVSLLRFDIAPQKYKISRINLKRLTVAFSFMRLLYIEKNKINLGTINVQSFNDIMIMIKSSKMTSLQE